MANMFAIFAFVSLFLGNFSVFGQRPHCNKFSFEEQLLEKMIRLEVKVETMLDSITKTQLDITELTSKVNKELNLLSKERERIKQEISVHKADTHEKLLEEAKNMAQTVDGFESKLNRFSADFVEFQNNASTSSKDQSVTYIRWGRTTCPNASTTVYQGFAAGSIYAKPGGASNTICLPKDPQQGNTHQGQQGSYVYGAEYQDDARTKSIFGQALADEDVPCVVCEATTRTAVLMIPARKDCYEGWHREYTGYLMTSHHSEHRADVKCVDATPEAIPGKSAGTKGDLFYFVEAAGSLLDPPYTRGVELTCVVCTK